MKIKFILLFFILIFISILTFPQGGLILESSGKVYIKRLDVTSIAKIGRNLQLGDIVTTGDDGEALIVLSDGAKIDLFANSHFILREIKNNEDRSSVLGKFWNNIKDKFSDVEYSSAQSGTVGAIRSSTLDEIIFNDKLELNKVLELKRSIDSVHKEELSRNVTLHIEAIIYEKYGQFIEAEKNYLSLIESNPLELYYYDMLIDLYIKIEFYAHAQDLLKQKDR